MERRPLPTRRNRTFQFQPHFVAALDTPHRQPLAGMPMLDNQLANIAVGHQTLPSFDGLPLLITTVEGQPAGQE
jgi:hypothetical protein